MSARCRGGFLLLTCLLVGCASGPRKDTGGYDRDRLTAEELQASRGEDLLTAIQSLRPAWLRTRDRTFVSPTPVSVVVDGVRWNSAQELARIRINEVREVEYLSPADGTTRFGIDMAGGVIVVYRDRGGASP